MKARTYFRGGLSNPKGGVYKSPKNKNAEKCENNYIIVISDGGWPYGTDPNPIAKDLVKSDQVGSFILGYKGYTDYKYLYESFAKAGQIKKGDKWVGGTPLYADNAAKLLKDLREIIGIVSGNTEKKGS